ncbi:class I SAM-dependent methyltransferase [Aquimarina mytili]|uniref:Methyltransferase domain-containing protein n=1 Tax=Aquimarina mytili TaxID=874423 RepID=A0A936ZWC6_9FLAO|nr:class I SAM-dependent methyltransferase [Aquimarina mytili]MBL0683190.1 methyltransferase domain-containing protein [Aquimarina mytili]
MKRLILNSLKKYFLKIPKRYTKNHTQFDQGQTQELISSIEKNYLDRGDTKKQLTKAAYQDAIQGQLMGRLNYNRNRIIPWLDKVKPLSECSILEIGCGTGISTLALTEQGAKVTGIDIDGGALKVAEDRLKLANMEANFLELNANQIEEKFKDEHFDFVIFYASLEHMTISERIESLKQAWGILKKGSFLTVIETPNRLWYFDSHTAALPFYDWLPDDLAFYYSKFSIRDNFKDLYRELDDDQMNKFLRWGRGMSYHEFEVAIQPLKQINVISSLAQFEKSHFLKYGFKGVRYTKFLRSCKKGLAKGFCYPYLDIIIKKD